METLRKSSRTFSFRGAIEPIRRIIEAEHCFSSELFEKLFSLSNFVPEGHQSFYAEALTSFLHGEYDRAGNALIPQLENSLRYVLNHNGFETVLSKHDGTSKDATLSQLLSHRDPWRHQLETIFSSDYISDIDLLFNFGGGLNVRNEHAHGKLPVEAYDDENVIYGIWFILHLAIIPLVRRWEDVEAILDPQ